MSNRITQADLEEHAAAYKAARQAAGKRTWFSVEYYNGWAHLHEVDADMEARHCSLRKVTGGTKRECYEYITAAFAGLS